MNGNRYNGPWQLINTLNLRLGRCGIWLIVAGVSLRGGWSVDGMIITPPVRIWDISAGMLMVREAGGMVTDFTGDQPPWRRMV